MKTLLIACTLLYCSNSFSQDRGEFWLGAGASRDVKKDLTVSFQTNLRTSYTLGVQTWYNELGIKSTHLGWFRPSLDYRLITSFDKLRNSTLTNRLNLNFDFRGKLNNFRPGIRFRYQFFLGNSQSVGSDLDPSFRIKPYVIYKIDGKRLSPSLSAEYFYDPSYGPTGRRFNRQRYGLGSDIDLPGSNEASVTLYYGRKFNTGNPYNEYLISLEYNFDWKKDKE